ncbi:MAG: hypothetical protein O7C75_12965 [Verrucomicrobia bacterium]|nr:hypothetical protein [Verrucomicrobiota bacterium]
MCDLCRIRSLTAGLFILVAAVIPVSLTAATASKEWFSVVSILKHEQALNRAHDVQLSGNLAFVPGKGGSIAIIDVTQPEDSKILWYKRDLEELGDSETVLPLGSHLLLGTNDFYSLDIADPENPVFLKKISDRTEGRIDKINGMVKRGNTVFAANKSGWINAFDVSDLESPTLAGALNVSKKFDLMNPHDIDSFGEYVIIVDPRKFGRFPTGKIAIFKVIDDVSGQTLHSDDWVLTGEIEKKELIGANRVQVSGSFAFIACSWNPDAPNPTPILGVVDISNPHFPQFVASTPFPDVQGPNGLTIAGKIAFPAGGETVEAVDITDPMNPVKLGSQKLPASNITPDTSRKGDNAHDLVYRDGYLYLSCQSDNSFMILKINDERILSLAESG